jgi:hypothetical protein
MRVFVSYARNDREAVDALLQDIRRARHEVWVDEELTGGQAWWETILGTIRGADLFVVALSPNWLKSRACSAELEYATGCNRTVLPVMLGRVSPQLTPPVIANVQILDYLERTPDAAISLVTALAAARPSLPLPDPLPIPPVVPMSYMNTYRERLDELSLSLQQQSLLLSELRSHLSDDDDRDTAAELIHRLRRRGDITESVGKEIDAVLASLKSATAGLTAPATTTSSPTASSATATSASTIQPLASTGATAAPAAWHPDPYRRFEQRYWDGSAWTEHVVSGGRRTIDPPSASSHGSSTQTTTPTTMAPGSTAVAGASGTTGSGPWETGIYVLLILATVFCGIVGVIVGAINIKKPARRSQAQVLLVLGIVAMLISFMYVASTG